MENYIYVIFIIIFLVMGWFSYSVRKTQLIKLLNVFVSGPLIIWASFQIKQKWARLLLLIFGATTISYNAKNWWSEHTFIKDVSITNPASWSN
jgi:hypothetical protein